MSPQESQALQDFLNQLTQVRGIAKDPQADAMIASAVAQQPDAAYLLVQRALLMEQALNSSKAQIASLQTQLQALQAAGAAPSSRGFLDGNSWGNNPGASARPAPAYAPAYAPASGPVMAAPAPAAAAAYQAAPAPAPSSGFFGGGLGSTLGTVAATAAGVAGGAFLFQGIEHLMNSGSGSSHQNGLSAPVETIENTTVNNYYGSDSERDRSRDDSRDDSSSNDSSSSDSFADNSDFSDFGSDLSGFDDSIV